ncbi:MAG: serine/threonine protein kinase [Pirellulales bacterium]|nr:serine/threonine protein kinase [Pirellulales bacterium]
MNLPDTHMHSPGQDVSEAKRFTYPGGSRPLDGFTIKRGVGHGGFGEVYYATSDAGKEVALKLIRRSLEIELRGIKQCLNLKHPNLLGVFDIREDARGDHWVVMEYVAGDCLDEVIARHPNGMPTHEALAWLAGIAAGVGYLHDHGIVHRDLKPGNIFSEEGQVSIGDYGLSKFISCSRRSGHTESVGTVHYMAPEVANGRYGKEIDIYALGIILYEMLTGRVPFEGESVGEVLMKHLTAKPDVSMLAEPYRGVVARALEKDPEKRFASVEEMLAQLPVDRSARQLPHARVTRAAPAGANGSADASPTQEPFAASPFVAQQVDDEPILRELRGFWANFVDWWRGLNPGAQVAVAVLGAIGLLATATYWIPLGFLALVAYGIYRLVRAIVLAGSPKPAVAPGAAGVSSVQQQNPTQPPEARKHSAPRKQYRHFRPYERSVRALIVKPARERLADLLGSMLVAALVATIMTVVVAMVLSVDKQIVQPELVAYVLLVSIAGSWGVLAPAKLWEGVEGDAMVRRFVMMTVGLGLGIFAWICTAWIDPQIMGGMLYFSDTLKNQVAGNGGDLADLFRAGRGMPPLWAHVLTFGLLMSLVRWWRQADPLRPARLSLWPVFTIGLVAMLVAVIVHAMGWAVAGIACIMSVSIQLASPWINPRLRQANVEE